jgi:hypothetical protein
MLALRSLPSSSSSSSPSSSPMMSARRSSDCVSNVTGRRRREGGVQVGVGSDAEIYMGLAPRGEARTMAVATWRIWLLE